MRSAQVLSLHGRDVVILPHSENYSRARDLGGLCEASDERKAPAVVDDALIDQRHLCFFV